MTSTAQQYLKWWTIIEPYMTRCYHSHIKQSSFKYIKNAKKKFENQSFLIEKNKRNTGTHSLTSFKRDYKMYIWSAVRILKIIPIHTHTHTHTTTHTQIHTHTQIVTFIQYILIYMYKIRRQTNLFKLRDQRGL